jgi:hypothetical protein
LGKKIEESEYATGLVHRVRDVMRRLRLGAPSVTDRGPGLDPNTVSEYLDNTLPADRVTDFEKVCLDSDVHLAEVASCHQILTLVLGEPAEIDQATRDRMYGVQDVPSGAKPPPPPPVGSPISAASADAPALSLDLEIGDDAADRKPRPRPTVPEYLRDPRRRRTWLSVAAAVAVAVCVLGVVLKGFGQLEPETPIGNFLVRLGIVAAPPEVAVREKGQKDEGEEKGKEATATAKGSADKVGKEPATKSGTKSTDKSSPAEAVKESKTSTAEPPAAPVKETKTTPPPVKESKVDAGTVPEPGKTPPDTGTKLPPKPGDVGPVAPPKPADDAGKETAPLPPPAQPEPLGKLLSSEQQVLLSDNPSSGWTRVAANQVLIPQEILALPTYRPKVGLTAGVTADVTAEILGGTRVELLGSSPQELAGLRILFGQVVLMPVAKGGPRLRVAFGDRSGTITLVDAESVAALEVHRVHPPGTYPESEPRRVTADLFVSGGAVLWEETVDGKAAQQRLTPSQQLSFDGQSTEPPKAVKEFPTGVGGGGSVRPSMGVKDALDRRASPVIAQGLPTDRLARVGLLELIALRPQQWETKWLSLRCLGYVGQFRDMVVALNDPAQKSHWPDYIDALRAAVDRDSQTAAAVRVALEKQYPQNAAELYRMLWGYTNKQLESGDDGKGGEDAKLVQGLKNDDVLAVRVLSYWNLKDITGRGEIYQPEHPPARRLQEIRGWNKRLEAKEIRLKPGSEEPSGAHEAVKAPAPDARQ